MEANVIACIIAQVPAMDSRPGQTIVLWHVLHISSLLLLCVVVYRRIRAEGILPNLCTGN